MTRGGLQTWIHFFSMLQYLCKKDQRSLYTLETAAKLTFVSHPSEVLKPIQNNNDFYQHMTTT